jgi:ABC-type spermidine/putrescine transport system permease subunit II
LALQFAAQCLGASRLQIFALVALPATVPYILTGMRLAMANAFVTIVAAELVFDEAQRALTPGQICALYEGDQLLGGGVFEEICYE